MREYKASFDMVSRIITAGVAVLFLAMNAYSIYNFHNRDENVSFVLLILSFLLTVGIFIGCYLFHPAKYVVTNDMVIVKRPFKDKQFTAASSRTHFWLTKVNWAGSFVHSALAAFSDTSDASEVKLSAR